MTTHATISPAGWFQPLCDARGRLDPAAVGWSVRPRVNCQLPGNLGRRKRWNHWCIVTPGWMLSLTIADLDYLGYGAIYFLDLETGKSVSRSQLQPFGWGCQLPDMPNQSHSFQHDRLTLKFDEQPGRLRISAHAPDLGGLPMLMSLEVQRPSHLESVNLVAPMGGRHFHACSRQMGLPITGSLRLGSDSYHCEPGQSFAALDFGRGVWPLNSWWQRAAFAAPGGIAGNFGWGWTDRSELKENALWFGGELLHLRAPVEIRQPADGEQAPWNLSSACGSVELLFIPRKLHRACPTLACLYSDTRQWFGRFDGFLRNAAGTRVPVAGALGWIGETNARW
ncbi:hypothetical protein D9M68_154150 [compost metagenome]|uniref:DUF2804 domain-containing protein n=1 Tax=Pseudomonas jinjuensis TaxID=198616 RepID=A0A1H0AS45_9PSED|nr:DUF2804 domain-containing protein [Pseudomonas jinjuensis]SDN36169.1 Protein of unknown function [Pseudomonas jinjuensis]